MISFSPSVWTARRGARLMDAERPGWAGRIDQAHLVMSSGMDCILGQEYGSYCTGLRALELRASQPAWNGFSIFLPFQSWSGLDRAWLAEISKRVDATPQDSELLYA